jgi:hypothetical protein
MQPLFACGSQVAFWTPVPYSLVPSVCNVLPGITLQLFISYTQFIYMFKHDS